MKVVFTAVISNYDILRPPLFVSKDWRFLCFSTENISCQGWEIVKVEKQSNSTIQARLIKIFPEFNFDYSHFLWHDANLQLIGNLDNFIEPLLNNDITVLKHPDRENIYQEKDAILRFKKDLRSDVLQKQILTYKLDKYHCNALSNTAVLFRKKSDKVFDQAKIWREQVLKFSWRDQMSFDYSCWKANIEPFKLLASEKDGNTFKYFLHPHKIRN